MVSLNTNAFFFIVQHNSVFHIYYLCSIILTQKRISLVGWCAVLQALGPGFDSQVPHILNNFCYNMFMCSFLQTSYHMSQRSGLPSVPEDPSNGHNVDSTVHLSQPLHMQSLKVKKGFALLGQTASKKPPFGSRHPQGLLNS